MQRDPRERVEFLNAQVDGDLFHNNEEVFWLLKFRIRNRSDFEVWLESPTIEIRDKNILGYSATGTIILKPGEQYILEVSLPEYDIDSVDMSKYRITNTGHSNKV
ncbi:MAG: hypothetical protein OXU21_02600 [Chloroflexota bacterium]|nr:hypothetical protein [Chloroflexota bacterium]